MSLAEPTRSQSSPPRRSAASTVVGLTAAVLVFAFVLTSTLIQVLPEFRFDSQFPALLPFFAWAGATGVGHLANLGRGLLQPWRAALGVVSLVPYVGLLLVSAVVPDLVLPWWTAPVAAGCAAVPFLLLGLRARTPLAIDPTQDADEASLRGTFLIGVSLMLLAYAAAGPVVTGAVASVLLAVALVVASLMTHGLARASHTWHLRHWVALAWGSLVIWASVLLHGVTHFFNDPWYVFTVVVLAGLPLIGVNAREARRRAPGPVD